MEEEHMVNVIITSNISSDTSKQEWKVYSSNDVYSSTFHIVSKNIYSFGKPKTKERNVYVQDDSK